MAVLELWFVRARSVPRVALWQDLLKDGAFVLASAVAVHWLLSSAFARIARSEAELVRSRERQRATAELLHLLNQGILRGEPIAGRLETVCGHLVDTFGYASSGSGRRSPTAA